MSYGSNYYGQGYYAQSSSIIANLLLKLLHATTKFVAGFHRSTRRLY